MMVADEAAHPADEGFLLLSGFAFAKEAARLQGGVHQFCRDLFAEFLVQLKEQNIRNRHSQPMAGQSLIATLVIGFLAGWLASHVVRGGGLGIVGDVIVGILGAFIGGWLLPRFHIHLGSGTVAAIANATIGAVLLLFLIRLVRGGGGWRSRWGARW